MSDFVKAIASCRCNGRPWERDLPKVLSWECEHCGGRWCVTPAQIPEIAELQVEVARLRALVEYDRTDLEAEVERLKRENRSLRAEIVAGLDGGEDE